MTKPDAYCVYLQILLTIIMLELKIDALLINSSFTLSRHDYHFKVMGRSILDEIDEIYRQASYLKLWSVVRYSAALLGKVVDSLAPAITTMLVSGRQVSSA